MEPATPLVQALRLRLVALFLSIIAALSLPAVADADVGHVALSGGATSLNEQGGTRWRPKLRTEIAFRLGGPFELGAFLQTTTQGFPIDRPAFGGGPLIQLRPEAPLAGFFVPHLELAGSRLTIPTADRSLDAWGLSVGGGIGFEMGAGVGLEARVRHHWYLGLPAAANVGDSAWTATLGITFRLPG